MLSIVQQATINLFQLNVTKTQLRHWLLQQHPNILMLALHGHRLLVVFVDDDDEEDLPMPVVAVAPPTIPN